MLGLRPEHAQDAARCQLIDIRPAHERFSGLGFIAGSRGLPPSDDLDLDAEAIDRLAGTKLPVLVCLSGHRSRGKVLALAQAIELPLGYLEGGLLAWEAAGLPLAGRWTDVSQMVPMEHDAYRQMLRSQIDVLLATVNTGLRSPTDFVLERCAVDLCAPIEHWGLRQLQQLPETLAVVLLDLELPRDKVSPLIDQLMARMPEADSLERAAS